MVAEVCRSLHHAPRVARGAHPAFAGIGHAVVVSTIVTPRPGQAMRKDAAFRLLSKGLADIRPGGVVVALAVELIRAGQLKPSLEVLGNGLNEGLDPDHAQCARNQMIQNCGQLWQQRCKVLHTVLSSDQHYDGSGQFRQALLKLEVSICGDEGVEFRRCQSQQLAIRDASPPFLTDGRNLVVKNQRGKVVWQRFIKRDAHQPPGTPWPFQEQRLPDHA